jgi:hypothetical protein
MRRSTVSSRKSIPPRRRSIAIVLFEFRNNGVAKVYQHFENVPLVGSSAMSGSKPYGCYRRVTFLARAGALRFLRVLRYLSMTTIPQHDDDTSA